jgi:ubiquinone/menaquinone biosynthesis C-methylase UbiE
LTTSQPQPIGLGSRLVNRFLAIKPLANFAKRQARKMMINRAESIGVPWRSNVERLKARNWERELTAVENPDIQYPDYYLTSFHAAWEVESAAYAVHAKIWSDGHISGDRLLRESYHDVLTEIAIEPEQILDLGCSVGMSTLALQAKYPQAKVTGVDLSPYFLAVAQYRTKEKPTKINWLHAAAETTGLPDASYDLVSACLMFHELPQAASLAVIREASRLLRPGGYLAIMDMNPQSKIFQQMPPYVLTLLKSTEPYLDEYFDLDLEATITQFGFANPTTTVNTPRHRTLIARRLDI